LAEEKNANDDTHGVRTGSLVVLATIAVLVALYFARDFFVPIFFAMMLNAVFRPVVRGLQRVAVPAWAGAGIVVLTLVGALVLAVFMIQRPVQHWFAALPQTFDRAQGRLEQIRAPVRKVVAVADQLKRQTQDLTTSTTKPATTQSSTEPTSPDVATKTTTPVVAQSPPAEPVSPQPPGMFTGFLGTTTAILGGIVEVLVLLLLILAGGGMFHDKLREVIPTYREKRDASRVVHLAQTAVRRYLLVTLLINIVQGALVAVALWWLKMPNPILWGGLTVILEFVPYLGATVMIVLLSVVAFATLDGIGHILMAPLSYLLVTTIQNNVVSPLAYGRNLKLNPVVILIAVLFWWFLWGTPGAFLAVPILATMKVVADHSERLAPLGVFLGESSNGVASSAQDVARGKT
jgi:predicted PurR-regulated permease PerM